MNKTNFVNFFKKHCKKLIFFIASVLVISFLLMSCQGLVNANGTDNSIVISKEVIE